MIPATKILIAEDEITTAQSLKMQLERAGYRVCGMVDTGEDAVQTAVNQHPDLVLMDIKLDGKITGIEAAEKIQSNIDVPVVYLATDTEENLAKQVKLTEPAGYIFKPVQPEVLKTVIETALYKQQIGRQLKEGEARYRRIVDDETELLIRHKQDGTLIFANQAYCQYYGTAYDEVIGKNGYARVHEEDRALVKQKIGSLTPEMPVMTAENRTVLADGTIRWLRWTDRGIFDDAGQLVEFQSVGFDITDRKEAEDALHQSEARARALLNATSAAVALLDRQGIILDNNRAHAARLGLPEDELIGRCVWDLFPPDVAAKRKEVVENVFRTAEAACTEDERQGVWNEYAAYPVFDADGKVQRVAVYAQDITERKQAEQHYRNVADFSYDWEYWISPDGSLIYVSPTCERVTGYSPAEVAARPELISEITLPEDRDALHAHNNNTHASLEKGEIRFRLRHRDGSVRWIEHFCQPVISQTGEYLGRRASNRDSTERIHAEQALQKSDAHHQALFRDSPIELIEKDCSNVKIHLDELRASGISDFEAYFEKHPDEVIRHARMIKVVDVNNHFIRLHGAADKAEMPGTLDGLLQPADIPRLRRELVAIATGETYFECEYLKSARQNNEIFAHLTWVAAPGYEDSLSKVFVSIIDISDRKKAEAERSHLLKQVQDGNERLQSLSRRLLEVQEAERRHIARELHDEIGQALTAVKIDIHAVQQKVDISVVASRLE